MARVVHDLAALVVDPLDILPLAGPARAGRGTLAALAAGLAATALAGCLLPPSLDTDLKDAAPNAAPSILKVSTDAEAAIFEPGPIALTRNSGGLILELYDTDVNDTLVVRLFVDYLIDDPKPARAECTRGPSGTEARSVRCDASTVCQMADDGKRRNLTAVVFDREPLESGDPRFQAMDAPGLSTSRFFFIDCAGPST